MILNKYILFLSLVVITLYASGQGERRAKRINYKAETLTVGKRDGLKYQKLIERVVFTQNDTRVNCDSSFYFKKTNIMEAYGRVKIIDDSVTIRSRKLIYRGNSRDTDLRDNVIYQKGEQRMYTDFLDYNLDSEEAHYFNGGKLLDSTNTLTSEEGFFYGQEDRAIFYNDVVLVSPDFTLKTDTLRYNTLTKIAYTDGPTVIEDADGSQLFSEGGVFRTRQDQSDFEDGKVQTEDYELDGDNLFFDDLKRYYRSIGNVVLAAKTKDVIIVGDEGFYDKKAGISKVYGNPVMKRILKADTFFLAADTLVAIESEYDSAERILAYNNIRIYKQDLQGKSDSASYFLSDSLIYLYRAPILWNGKNQITADTISLYVTEDTIRQMNLYRKSFLVGQDTLQNFNQIKGRNMEAFFANNLIDFITVDGNAEGIYYVLGDGDSTVMGMNKFICSTMRIGFTDQQVSTISIYDKPEAKFIPPHELSIDLTRLPGYSWRSEERPSLEDIFKKAEEQEEELLPEMTVEKEEEPSTHPEATLKSERSELLKNVKKEND